MNAYLKNQHPLLLQSLLNLPGKVVWGRNWGRKIRQVGKSHFTMRSLSAALPQIPSAERNLFLFWLFAETLSDQCVYTYFKGIHLAWETLYRPAKFMRDDSSRQQSNPFDILQQGTWDAADKTIICDLVDAWLDEMNARIAINGWAASATDFFRQLMHDEGQLHNHEPIGQAIIDQLCRRLRQHPRDDPLRYAVDSLPTPSEYLRRPISSFTHWAQNVGENGLPTLDEILAHPVLFYPGAGQDFGPLLIFGAAGIVDTVVYADYGGLTPEAIESMVARHCVGYKISSMHQFPMDNHERFSQDHRHQPCNSFMMMSILESRTGGHPLVLLYCHADAFAVYDAFWRSRRSAPLAIVIQDHGFGGNWGTFGHGGELHRMAGEAGLPRLLYWGGGQPWQEYQPVSQAGGNGEGMHHTHRTLFALPDMLQGGVL
jgi:hypothetical protein